ncbi:MAG: hypothetical protein KC619_14730 [Myxococcales bacterium]|nr:hypothetical protein [Myxococcales bacterium]
MIPSLEDREMDAVQALSARLARLRRLVLIPLALGSASTAIPAYVLLRDAQVQAQWSGGAEVAFHVPLLTGAFAMIPAALLFVGSVLLYRAIRDRRMKAWKTELCHAHQLPDGQLDEIGRIFH